MRIHPPHLFALDYIRAGPLWTKSSGKFDHFAQFSFTFIYFVSKRIGWLTHGIIQSQDIGGNGPKIAVSDVMIHVSVLRTDISIFAWLNPACLVLCKLICFLVV